MANTERISLISSFMWVFCTGFKPPRWRGHRLPLIPCCAPGRCSLFLGDYAPIDTSDGAGMNLMNLGSEVGSCGAGRQSTKSRCDRGPLPCSCFKRGAASCSPRRPCPLLATRQEWAEEVIAVLGADIEAKLGKPLAAYSGTRLRNEALNVCECCCAPLCSSLFLFCLPRSHRHHQPLLSKALWL